jgi:HAD superfamily hydrolase (TIGR01450 family)
MALSPLLAAYDHALLDLDGCVWVGDAPTPRAPEAVAALRAAGKGVAFVTNNSWLPPEAFVRKLWGLGFQAGIEEVLTPGRAIEALLADRGPGAALVLGSPALAESVTAAGWRLVDPAYPDKADVVVAGAHDSVDYPALAAATRAVLAGAELLAPDLDASFPVDGGLWPGSGAIVAAIERATGARAASVGKPAPGLFTTALARLGGGRALVIGDRVDADLAGAAAAGLDAALVLTGVSDRGAGEAAHPLPVAIGDDLASLVLAGGGADGRGLDRR